MDKQYFDMGGRKGAISERTISDVHIFLEVVIFMIHIIVEQKVIDSCQYICILMKFDIVNIRNKRVKVMEEQPDLYQQQRSNYEQNQTGQEVQKEGFKQNTYKNMITISEDTTDQILTVILQPKQKIWHQGQIIASNQPFNKRKFKKQTEFDRATHLLKFSNPLPTQIRNDGINIAYYCIKGRGGKILYLQEEVYQQTFLIDIQKLLTLNIDPQTLDIVRFQPLPYLVQLKTKVLTQMFKISLQSKSGNLIFQKSLGADQKLYLNNSRVIAMSKYVKVKNEQSQILLKGPGLVFLEIETAFTSKTKNLYMINFGFGLVISIFMTIVVIVLTFYLQEFFI